MRMFSLNPRTLFELKIRWVSLYLNIGNTDFQIGHQSVYIPIFFE